METSLSSENQELQEMCNYVAMAGGKRLRPSLCILAYYACGGKGSEIPVNIGSAFEIIHSATLIHDDINDEGEFRRGRKTLHKEYTVSKAIIAGDFMFAVGFSLLAESAPKIVGFILDASAAMGAGEFVQKDFEHNARVTEENYLEIISRKTAKLFEASAGSGATMAGVDSEIIEAIGAYAHDLGMAFQIVDDTLDMKGDPNKTGKIVGSDLLEGKPTLPIIYAMEDREFGSAIRGMFEQGISILEVPTALKLINKTDAVERCLARARGIAEVAIGHLDIIPDSEYKTAMIRLAEYVVSRER